MKRAIVTLGFTALIIALANYGFAQGWLPLAGPGGPPLIPCANAAGLKYNQTCDTVYFMGVFQ